MLYARLFLFGLLLVVIGGTSGIGFIAKAGAVLVVAAFVVAGLGLISPALRGR
ncbi:hypothetical protein [Oceanobacter mangrovi]|uniref:hypothetical protein n=1 Tax=Oceanobacter mangrovi TaxID=2862510 RepID=UPI001C8EC730|nr:hypothetical protein [Oceanobacter mangrovi]